MFAQKLPTGRNNDKNPPTSDLFGNAVEYRPGADGKSFTVKSLGRDGKPGGDGVNADVSADGE